MVYRRSAKWPGFLVCLVASLVGAGQQAETNLLPNADFESGGDKEGTPVGWSRGQWQKPEWLALDGQVKKEGQCSLRMEAREACDGRLMQELPVEPDAAYRLTGWVRTANLRPDAQVGFYATLLVREGPNMAYVTERGKNHAGTTDWVQETVDFVGPQDGKVAIACEVASGTRATGRIWFDGLRVERLASPCGLAFLKDPTHGDWVRAARVLQSMPPDWAALAGILENFFAAPEGRAAACAREHLEAFHAGAKADPKAREMLVRFWSKCSLNVPPDAWPQSGARAVLEEAAKAPAPDPKVGALVRLGLARAVALESSDPAAAAKAIEQAIGGDAAVRKQVASVALADVNFLQRKQAHREALELLEVFLTLVGPRDEQRPSQEFERVKLLMQVGEHTKALQSGRRLAAPDSGAPSALRSEVLRSVVNLEVAVGDPAEDRKWAVALDDLLAKEQKQRSNVFLDYATALAGRQRWEEVEKECRQVIAAWPQDLGVCLKAQALIVTALVGKGRLDEAIGAAKILYGAVPNTENGVTEAAMVVMSVLKAKYRSIAPANEYALFQQYGPNGPDGKPGTDDDLKDPVGSFPCAVPGEAAAAFKKTIEGLPQDFGGRRCRGYLCLFAGEPALALKEFAKGFPLTLLDQKSTEDATDDIVVALRAYYGHPSAGERFIEYVKYGPNGKDGKPGTGDDLADPVGETLGKK